jgi:hypothetical protein
LITGWTLPTREVWGECVATLGNDDERGLVVVFVGGKGVQKSSFGVGKWAPLIIGKEARTSVCLEASTRFKQRRPFNQATVMVVGLSKEQLHDYRRWQSRPPPGQTFHMDCVNAKEGIIFMEWPTASEEAISEDGKLASQVAVFNQRSLPCLHPPASSLHLSSLSAYITGRPLSPVPKSSTQDFRTLPTFRSISRNLPVVISRLGD